MNLAKLNVQELNKEEMVAIEGGGFWTDLVDGIGNALSDAAEWVWDHLKFGPQ